MRRIRRILIAATALAAAAPPAFADALQGKLGASEILAASKPEDWSKPDPESLLYIQLDRGVIVVMLAPDLAKAHVAQVKALARAGFYDGLSFYRVIDGFVAQGGDWTGKKPFGKPAKRMMKAEFDEAPPKDFAFNPLPDEDGYAPQVGFSRSLPAGLDPANNKVWHLHCTGAFAFGREDGRDTAATEFYVTLQPQRYLDRNLSVFGRVIFGMEHLQALRRVNPPQKPEDDAGEKIVSFRVGADLPEEQRVKLEILRSDTETFKAYVESKRNRPEAFFYFRPDHVDICQLAVPVRAAQ
jgi:peptidylprolyl isomerase